MPSGQDRIDAAGRTLPGTYASCALLTLLTVLLAWPGAPTAVTALVPPAFFGLLAWYFARAAAMSPELRGQPMGLVIAGFAIRCASTTVSATIGFLRPDAGSDTLLGYVRFVCDDGALFLLGTTLGTFGLMLWIPQVVASHRLLARREADQRHQLAEAVTERTLLERHLVDADRRGMLAELAASIAHDLRNPLTIVKGTAESLCRRPRTSHEIAEHTAVIRRNVDKADRTIQALIELARPHAPKSEPVTPLQLLQDVADLLQTEVRRRRLHLTMDRAAAACPPLQTDRTLLIQALLNLALNALQATPAGGTVRLAARTARSGGADAVLLLVEDDGHGLPADVRRKLFTPFFTTKAEGTGLGLASCRRIAAELGGALRLYPRGRKGARAVLALPRQRRAATTANRSEACATSNC